MTEQAPARPEVPRPSVVQTGLWAVVALLALLGGLIALLVAVGVLIEPQPTSIDPAELPQGTPWYVVESTDGDIALTDCPALLGRTSASPSWCAATDETSVRALILAPIIGLALGFVAVVTGRRTWRCVRLRSAPPPPWPPAAYQQEGMPWGFWLAAGLVGSLALLIDWVTIASFVHGELGAGPRGAIVWTGIFVLIVVRYGRRSAVSLRSDGETLVWRAPLRSRRMPLAEVVAYEVGASTMLGERPATLHRHDGTSLEVSVPNRRHGAQLEGFLWSLGIPRQHRTV